jgi:hypothetical protein
MRPKEKAEELYFKYKEALNIKNDMRIGANPFAKECALIAVDEILKAVTTIADKKYDFYVEVKQEIEKL